MWKYVISLALLLGAHMVLSQDQNDSTGTAFTLQKLKPRAIRAGVDALSLIRTGIRPDLYVLEGKAEADFGKYIGVFELGSYSNAIDSLPRYRYNVKGQFFRVGVDANFLSGAEDRSVFSFGLRYGRSYASDNLEFSFEDPVYGTVSPPVYSNPQIRAGWVEMASGLQVQIWKNVWMGYTARFKFGLKYRFQESEPFELPGYGRSKTLTTNNTTWGFNYYILISIP